MVDRLGVEFFVVVLVIVGEIWLTASLFAGLWLAWQRVAALLFIA